ncbi:proton-conducting transporter membrane subunit [Lamprobacter modestohalophilus]|uniref:complex I subunit 5 family protein n=1 Tax=Lamprobacter modestohalophilus TaxID=1064514 RepID=UPI002ADEB3EC|nr:proton-conducting transporter membrane subunit [Lamprobacter modestohalophilus]MEA1051293.1 proton-conducting transporter membrane subunit [Lamprobacter modestohalophilus]
MSAALLNNSGLLDSLSAWSDELLVLLLVLPVLAMLLGFVLGSRAAERIALFTLPLGLALAVAVAALVLYQGTPLSYDIGGWAPPLGVALRVDGLSAVLLLTTALVITGVGLYARADFATPADDDEARAPLAFWTLLLGLWAALNAVFIGQDLFNLYVAIELLTFTAVPLVCLKGSAETLQAALRYLLFALLGSVLYLLGTALLYGAYGTLDIGQLAAAMRETAEPAAIAAVVLMTVGLLAKTALVPLHLWLPPAHAGAPAAASAILSALVVKGSFFLIFRLWIDLMPVAYTQQVAQGLATLGAAAILLGGIMAIRQARLKTLIAYSTLAQLGYLFLIFPLLVSPVLVPKLADGSIPVAWTGGVLQLVSHAFAKASMFMGAGLIAAALGHDRINDLGGLSRLLPITLVAFALSGMSLMGLPLSGGFAAKWLLLRAAIETGQWWWMLVILSGGVLTGAYLYRVLAAASFAGPGAGRPSGTPVEPAAESVPGLSPKSPPVLSPELVSGPSPGLASASFSGPLPRLIMQQPVARSRELIVLTLALISIALGLVPLTSFEILQIGRGGEAMAMTMLSVSAEPVGLGAADLSAVEFNASGLNATELNAVEPSAAELSTAELGAAGLSPEGLSPVRSQP